MSDR
ncbi:hypothetical protein MRX96_006793 [Rhipicephalus microplus]|jgi:hypothetical protein